VSALWIFASGKPITIPDGIYYDNENTYYHIGERNSYRLSAYHRLDLSIQFLKIRRTSTRIWEIGVYNAYNRKNPYSLDFQEEYAWKDTESYPTGKVKIMQYSLLPIIPSINYTIKW
jgi:hypothetical protein